MSNNQLKGNMDIFNGLSNLKILNLSSNLIEYVERNTFSNLLKLKVVDLSGNLIFKIKQDSFNGLVNLRELYLNHNRRNMKIENSSFNDFNSIQTIYLSRSIFDYSDNKLVLINTFKDFTLNDDFYDCDLVFEFLKFNILFNLKTDNDYSNYLFNCQFLELK